MAKKKKPEENPTSAEAAITPPKVGGKPESVSGYFRKLFHESPKLLHETSNAKILDRWLADHPDQTEVPKTVKSNLANLKSVLRSKKRDRVAGREQARVTEHPADSPVVARKPTGSSELEALEHQIDECLTLARTEDRVGLEGVIRLLRRARNAVVWKMGQ